MSEPEEKPQEATAEIVRVSFSDQVMILIRAYELAEIAERYETKKGGGVTRTKIYYNEGTQTAENPTLASYIKEAENKFIKDKSAEILADALSLLENELADVRELVNG